MSGTRSQRQRVCGNVQVINIRLETSFRDTELYLILGTVFLYDPACDPAAGEPAPFDGATYSEAFKYKWTHNAGSANAGSDVAGTAAVAVAAAQQ